MPPFFSRYTYSVAIFLCLAIPSVVQALTLPVDQDASVNSAHPSKPNGAGPKLLVDSNDSALFDFSYTSVPSGTTSAEVAKATLRLWVNTKKDPQNEALKIYSLPTNWDEHTLTSASAPAVGALIAELPISNLHLGNWLAIDVSTMVKNYLDNPSTAPAAIRIQASSLSSKATVAFDSKENTGTAHPAWIDLELVHTGPKGDTGTQGPAGANGLGYSPQQVALLRWYELIGVGNNFTTGNNPTEIAFDGSDVWISNSGSGSVTKLKGSDGSLIGTYAVGNSPWDVAFDGANVWVVNTGSDSVTKLKASDGSVVGTYPVGASPQGIAFDGVNMWVANYGSNTITKLKASDGGLVGSYNVGSNPFFVAFDGANVWVANYASNNVSKLKASDGSLLGTYTVGSHPTGVLFDGINVWVANFGSNNVTKLKASDGSLLGTYSVGSAPIDLAFDGKNIWVTNLGSNSITQLKSTDGSVAGTYDEEGGPYGVAFDGASIWVANYFNNNVSKR